MPGEISKGPTWAYFEGMTWTLPGKQLQQIAWRLRYTPAAVSVADCLVAAAAIDSYTQMVGRDSQEKRHRVIRHLRQAMKEADLCSDTEDGVS